MKKINSPDVERLTDYWGKQKPKKTKDTIANILAMNGYTPEQIKKLQKDNKVLVRIGHLGRKLRSGDVLYVEE